MAGIELRSLSKEYGGGIKAVEDLSLNIEDGEFIVIVGPSGCGKSTTLNMIAGLEKPTGGEIIIGEEDVTEKDPKDRNIAMVFQNYALYPHMNVRKNLSFGLRMRTDLSEEEIDSSVGNVAKLLEIGELVDQMPKELSGGQRQRVALGRAIIRDPEVFLLDEPLSNLDAKLRSSMRTELQDLHHQLGITTIYVTHDQTEAMTMSDRMVILNEGKLQQVGTPLECYHQPVNRFVASFIGSPSMNFFDVEIGKDRFYNSGFDYQFSDGVSDRLTSEVSEAILGIRPEDIELSKNHATNSINAKIEMVEPMGNVTNVIGTIGDSKVVMSLDGGFRPNSENINVTFDEDDIYLFDVETERSILKREVKELSEIDQ